MLLQSFILDELVSLQAERSPSFHAMLSVAPKLEAISSIPVGELTVRHVESTLASIPTTGPRGKARMLLARAIRRARGDGAVERDVMALLPKFRSPAHEGRAPSENAKEVLSMRELRNLRVNGLHGGLWVFLCASGLRASEVLALTTADLEPMDGTVKVTVRAQKHAKWGDVRETKTASIREVFVDSLLVELPTLKSSSSMLTAWHRDLAACGLERRRLHATRHTFVSTMVRCGVKEHVVRDMTHPKGGDAFGGYLHVPANEKQEAARAFARAFAGEGK